MAKTRRRKKRTHKVVEEEASSKVPKSFVLRRGKLSRLLQRLEGDLRNLMMPHTATRLKESKKNNLKDFLHVAGPLGVSHFLMLSSTDKAAYLRVAKTPRGPTLTFKVHSYALARDLANAQARYKASPTIFRHPPLVVLNNFTGGESHLKLVTVMFQNLFPAINVKTVQLSHCQRVLLLNYNAETDTINFRHYAVSAQPTGVSRSVRKLVQGKAIPNLSNLEDVSEFVTRSGYGSESEVEDEASKVTLAQDLGRGNRAANQSAVKLHEIGPRMELELVKVQEGLSEGKVLFHKFIHKSEGEAADQDQKVKSREELREQRRRQQEENVRKKEQLKFAKKSEKEKKAEQAKQKRKREHELDMQGQEEDDDEEWYRQEVGEEPEEGLMQPQRMARAQQQRLERRSKRDELQEVDEDVELPSAPASKKPRQEGVGRRDQPSSGAPNTKKKKQQQGKGPSKGVPQERNGKPG